MSCLRFGTVFIYLVSYGITSCHKTRTIVTFFVFCFIGGCATTAVKEERPNTSIEVYSLWQGTFDQVGWETYPMILFISWRMGDSFEGMTWYPTLDNSLLAISGKIKPDGVIMFTEDKVIRGPEGTLSGGQYSANLEGNTLEGPSFLSNNKVGNFVLKYAD